MRATQYRETHRPPSVAADQRRSTAIGHDNLDVQQMERRPVEANARTRLRVKCRRARKGSLVFDMD
jgi:hypothetical protein